MRKSRLFMRVCWESAAVLALCCLSASASDSDSFVYLPITFHAESKAFRTAAALRVSERKCPPGNWWSDPDVRLSVPESVFAKVISAFKRQDREALLRLSDTEEDKEQKRFNDQASAFFHQFKSVSIIAVPRYFQFDGMTVFYAKFASDKRQVWVPFVFRDYGTNSCGFLPARSEQLTFRLVNDWFNQLEQDAQAEGGYVPASIVKRATHRVGIWQPGRTPENPSVLFLKGVALDSSSTNSQVGASVVKVVDEMRGLLKTKNIDAFIKHMTPVGGSRLKEWYASAEEDERQVYRNNFVQYVPFFLFDAGSLVVVYGRSASGFVEVFYFTYGSDNRLLWANSSHLSVTDKVFKKDPLHMAASESPPFGSLEIK